jgi:hypothetical protein
MTDIERKSLIYEYTTKCIDTSNFTKSQLAGFVGKLNLSEDQEEGLLNKALALRE